jgi:hypothetical protein
MRAVLARSVIEGRISLAEAAEHYRKLNEGASLPFREGFRAAFPAHSDQERCYLQVIAHVRFQLENDPVRCAKVVERMEKELQELQQRRETGTPKDSGQALRRTKQDQPRKRTPTSST